jgi:hypothetical protein
MENSKKKKKLENESKEEIFMKNLKNLNESEKESSSDEEENPHLILSK